MSPKQIQYLLDDLCVGLGFCLPRTVQDQLISKPPADIDAFTDAVMRAEGIDPTDAGRPRELRRMVRACVAKYFNAETDNHKR